MRLNLFISAFILFLVQCSPEKNSESELESYPVISPVTKDTVYTEDYVASIQSVQNVDVRTRISGYLDKIHVDEGQQVKKGQLIFSLGDQEFREELAKASAVLKTAIADAKTAEVDLQNTESLVEKNVLSKTALELAKAKVDAANAGIEEAKAHEAGARLRLAYTEIRAPFDGVIDRFPIKAGSVVKEGDLLTSISDSKEVFAYFNFSETEYLDYILSDHSEGKGNVQLVMANNAIYPHKGVIETVEGKINTGTGNIAFRARFPNPGSILKHGSSGKVLISRSLDNVLMVPQKCTFEIQGDIYVYTIDDQNTARMTPIRTALAIPHWYVIESGLRPADKVIYEGIQLIREGEKINPTTMKIEQVIAKR